MNYEPLLEQLEGYMAQALRHPAPKGTVTLTQGELGVLRYLVYERDGATPGMLRDSCGVGSGHMADTLKTLETKGYIRRSADPADNRRVIVNVTGAGQAYVEAKRREFRGEQRALLEALGERDALELVRLMGRIAQLKKEENAKKER